MKRREASEAGEACYLVLLTCCYESTIPSEGLKAGATAELEQAKLLAL